MMAAPRVLHAPRRAACSSAPLSACSGVLAKPPLPLQRRCRVIKVVAQAFPAQAAAVAGGPALAAAVAPVAAAAPALPAATSTAAHEQPPQPARGAVIASAAAAAAASALVFEHEAASMMMMAAAVDSDGSSGNSGDNSDNNGALAAAAAAALALVPPSLIALPSVAVAADGSGSPALVAAPMPAPAPVARRLRALAARAGRALAAPYHAYGRALDAHPLLTKALTSCAGFVLGDLLAQVVAAHSGGGGGGGGGDPNAASAVATAAHGALDAARLARLGAYGLTLDGPLGAAWYDWLEANVFPGRGASLKAVLAKTALDQLVFATGGTVLFLSANTLLEGRGGDEVGGVLAAKLLPTLAANWCVWPFAHLVNFKYVAPRFRVAYNQTVAIGWLALLSAMTHAQGGGGGGGEGGEGGGALLGALLGLLPGSGLG